MPNISAFFKKVQPLAFLLAFFSWAIFLTLAPPVEDVHDILIKGEYVYLALGKRGVRILKISDSAMPGETKSKEDAFEEVENFDTFGSANALALTGDTLFVADGRGGLLTLDLSDRAHPEIRSVFENSKSASDVVINDTHIFLADRDEGIWAFKVDDPSGEKWSVTGEQGFLHLAVRGNFLSGVGVDEKFYVFNINKLRMQKGRFVWPGDGGQRHGLSRF